MKARIAIISATGTGQKRFLPALAGSESVEVVAVHARDATKAAALAQQYGLDHAHVDAAEMLDTVAPDAVLIGSPPFLHADDVGLTASRGIPTLCEKPLAANLTDAMLIDETVRAAGIPFALAHHVRHQRAIVDIRDLLAAGNVGAVRRVEAQWSFLLNPVAANARWKLDPDLGGRTAFYDAGIHAIDLVLYLFGIPRAVRAGGFRVDSWDTYENVAALFEYDGMLACLSASRTLASPANALVIDGEGGRIDAAHAFGEQSIASFDIVTPSGKTTRTFPQANLYRNEVEDFVRLLDGGDQQTGTTLSEAVAAMRVLDAIDRSLIDEGTAAA